MTPCNDSTPLLRIRISNAAVLRACYMPYLRHKGLFVPSRQVRQLGEKLFLVLTLVHQDVTVAGMVTVCWITPSLSNDGREPGYGLHFDAAATELTDAVSAGLVADKYQKQPFMSYTF